MFRRCVGRLCSGDKPSAAAAAAAENLFNGGEKQKVKSDLFKQEYRGGRIHEWGVVAEAAPETYYEQLPEQARKKRPQVQVAELEQVEGETVDALVEPSTAGALSVETAELEKPKELRVKKPKVRPQWSINEMFPTFDQDLEARRQKVMSEFQDQQQLDFYEENPNAPLNVRGVKDRIPNYYVDGSGVRKLDGMKVPYSKDMLPLSRHYPRRMQAWQPLQANGEPTPYKGKVAVAGGGVLGLTSGMMLALRGFEVTIVEKRPSPTEVEPTTPHHTLLTKRALDILERAGIPLSDIVAISTKVKGIIDHPGAFNSPLTVNLCQEHRYTVNMLSVDLNKLRLYLTENLRNAPGKNVKIFHNHAIENVRTEERVLVAHPLKKNDSENDPNAEFIEHVNFDMLVVADGANSTTRRILEDEYPVHLFNDKFATRWFSVVDEQLEHDRIHRWLGKMVGDCTSMAMAFPTTSEHTFAVQVFAPFDELNSLTVDQIRESYCSDLPKDSLVATGTSQPTPHPTVYVESLVNSNKFPCAALLGDAAHAFNPFMMQGLSIALEDASYLLNTVDTNQKESYYDRLRQYSIVRGPSGDKARLVNDRHLYFHRHRDWRPWMRFQDNYLKLMTAIWPRRFNEQFYGNTNYRFARSVEEMMHGKGYRSYDDIEEAMFRHNHYAWFGRLYT